MKRCIKCSDPIYEPVLATDEDERCPFCGDEPDGLAELKQDAFIAGFEAGGGNPKLPPLWEWLTEEAYRHMAKDQHEDEGTLEIDDLAIVSQTLEIGGDDGAYVAAWVWVRNEAEEAA